MTSQPRGTTKRHQIISGEDGLWRFLQDKLDIALEVRRPFEAQWLLNLSFLSGKQYAFYNTSAQLMQQIVQRKGALRVIDNKILPRYRKQVSRLIKQRPKMSVVPSSTDQEDLKAAKVGDKVLKSFYQKNHINRKVRELAGWIYGTGNGFLDDRWNPKLGPQIVGPEGKLVYSGDADVGVWSPLEIGVPAVGLGECDLHSLPWVIKMKYRPLEYFPKVYGEKGSRVLAEDRPSPFVDTRSLFGIAGGGTALRIDGAVEVQLFLQPNGEYPKGLYLVGANKVILKQADYPFDEYSLEQFKDIEVPGVFWGMATSEAAIWLQKLHNRTLSDIAEFNRSMAKGKWLVPRNSRMEVMPDDTHGQLLLYSPVMGHKPEMMTMKGLPQSYREVLMVVANGLMELYNQHEVSMGTNKSDIRSGEMVDLLQEADNEGNIPTHAVFEESFEAVMARVLRRIQEGYGEKRVLSVVGKNNEIEVFSFQGADLKGNNDVHVEKQSSLPDSRLARQLRIKTNWKDGLYGDPMEETTRERVMKMLDEVPDDMEDVFKESHLDKENAKIENQAMMAQPGVRLLVNEYDDDMAHMQEHNYYRKQPEYQKLRYTEEKRFFELETTFMTHTRMHQERLAEARENQIKEMIQMEKLKKGGA